MKVIIVGAGRRGIKLAKHLVGEKKDVVLIDENPETAGRIVNSVDCLALVGSGTDIDVLKEAGAENADAFIALTGSDETNLVACAMASSEFQIPITICAIGNISYTNANNLMGITHIINPYQETAENIHRNIEQGIYSDIINFENSSFVLYNVFVSDGSEYAGKFVKDIRKMIPAQFIIAALLRNGKASVPNGDTVIQADDTLSLAAKEDSVESILSAVGKQRQKTKKIAIVGGTKIADFLIRDFDENHRKNITLIDFRREVCEDFSAKYPDILVINESITREGVFRQEGLENYDLLIALSDNDELNILIASYAKFRGVKAVISVIGKNADYMRIADHLNIDSIVSVQDASVDSIMRYLHGTNISTMRILFDGTIETFDYKVAKDSVLCGKLLKEIDMRGEGIIPGVIKQKVDGTSETIIPNGDYEIENGDILIVVVERKNAENLMKKLTEG